MILQEDDLTSALIEMHRKHEKNGRISEQDIIPEAHYNHFGNRGIADLYVKKHRRSEFGDILTRAFVYEVKSELRNANEVVRQVNRMKKFFFRDDSYENPDKAIFELSVIPNSGNYEHLVSYSEIYKQLFVENGIVIDFRHPENVRPVHAFAGDDLSVCIDSDEWLEYCKINNENVYNSIKGDSSG